MPFSGANAYSTSSLQPRLVLGEIEIERRHGTLRWRAEPGICTTAIVTIPSTDRQRSRGLVVALALRRRRRRRRGSRRGPRRGRRSRRRASTSSRGSISMKMHSPGHASAAWITCCDVALGGRAASDPEPPGSFSGRPRLGHVGDAVLELDEHVGAVVDAQAVAGAQVLVDPDAHGARHRSGRAPPVTSGGPSSAVRCRVAMDHAADRPNPSPRPQARTSWQRPTGRRRRPVGLARATATTRTPSPTSRPRTPTPSVVRRATGRPRRDDSSRRSSRGCRRPTSRCRSTTAAGGTSPAPSRAQSYPIYCRGRDPPTTADDHVMLDCNVEAAARATVRRYFDVQTVDAVARPPPARLVGRHRRQRALHAAGP